MLGFHKNSPAHTKCFVIATCLHDLLTRGGFPHQRVERDMLPSVFPPFQRIILSTTNRADESSDSYPEMSEFGSYKSQVH